MEIFRIILITIASLSILRAEDTVYKAGGDLPAGEYAGLLEWYKTEASPKGPSKLLKVEIKSIGKFILLQSDFGAIKLTKRGNNEYYNNIVLKKRLYKAVVVEEHGFYFLTLTESETRKKILNTWRILFRRVGGELSQEETYKILDFKNESLSLLKGEG